MRFDSAFTSSKLQIHPLGSTLEQFYKIQQFINKQKLSAGSWIFRTGHQQANQVSSSNNRIISRQLLYLNFYYDGMKWIETGSWLIENLNPSTVLNAENVGLAKLPMDIFGTSWFQISRMKWTSHFSGIRGLSCAVSFLLF